MKRIVLAGVAAWCVLGCVNEPPVVSEVPVKLSPAYQSELTPTTSPLVPLIVPDQAPFVLPPGQSAHQILNSQPELESFIVRFATPVPPGMPSAPPASRPGALATIDFAKYHVIAFADAGPQGTQASRIVGIEDKPDARVIHTVRWVTAGTGGEPGESRAALHMVAVARRDHQRQPLVFAATKQVSLTVTPATVRPSPQVGVPWEPGSEPFPNEQPRWRAVPNPEVTEATVEATAREMLKDLAVTSLTVERPTIAWTMEQLQVGGRDHWLPESDIWVVKAEGGPTRPGPGGQSRVPVSGVSPRLVTLLVSIEDGRALTSIGL